MAFTTSLDIASDKFTHIGLFENVRNISEVRQDVIGGRCSAALVSPQMVVGSRQVTVAACKAAHCHATNSMKTRSINTELIYWLSPTTSISNSLKHFGSTDQDTSLLAVVIDDAETSAEAEAVFKRIDGDLVPLERLAELSDRGAIEKHFQITPKELSFSSLEDSVITRAVGKEAV
ncbi:EKC/KEOPS complex subunit TPRKB-like [Sycon ciliatum]|uniref:EKC/KEOPS complex subunit TPRKB-like n=1 Tax=Sycon ciliatum TaxID=27933 RepID=UPI0020AAB9FE|eukprot:scpid83988/ scgid14040/ TP53RK-binding protein